MLNINITIQADIEGAFTAKEQNVLDALAGHTTQFHPVPGGVVEEKAPAPAPEATEEAAPEKPKRTRRTKAQIEAEKAAKEAAEAAEAAEEDEPKTLQEELAEDDEEDLRAKVVKLAGEMVSSGNPAGVRSALQSVGAKKVSEVKDKDLQNLFDALELNN